MIDKMIIDADLCIKLGGSGKYRYLYDVLPLVAEKIYMHTRAYSEVMIPASAVEQLKSLVEERRVNLVNENDLAQAERMVYDAAFRKLEQVMADPRRPNKNMGETSSLAYAKATGIPVICSSYFPLRSRRGLFLLFPKEYE